jgi:hypothetical protein
MMSLRKVKRQSVMLNASLYKRNSTHLSSQDSTAAAEAPLPPLVAGGASSHSPSSPPNPQPRGAAVRRSNSTRVPPLPEGAGGAQQSPPPQQQQQQHPGPPGSGGRTSRSSVAGMATAFQLAAAAADAKKSRRALGGGIEEMARSAGLTDADSAVSAAAEGSPDRRSLSHDAPPHTAGNSAAALHLAAAPPMPPGGPSPVRRSTSLFQARIESLTGVSSGGEGDEPLNAPPLRPPSRPDASVTGDGGSDADELREFERSVLQRRQSSARTPPAASPAIVKPSLRAASPPPLPQSLSRGAVGASMASHTIPEEAAGDESGASSDDGSAPLRPIKSASASSGDGLPPQHHAALSRQSGSSVKSSVGIPASASAEARALLDRLSALSSAGASARQGAAAASSVRPGGGESGAAHYSTVQQRKASVHDAAAAAIASSHAVVLADSSKAADAYTANGKKGLDSLLASLSVRAGAASAPAAATAAASDAAAAPPTTSSSDRKLPPVSGSNSSGPLSSQAGEVMSPSRPPASALSYLTTKAT